MKTQESTATHDMGGNPAPQANHLFAYSVEEYDAGKGKKARSWTRIGAAFPHKGEAHCAERRGTDAEAGPAAGSTTREPPGTGFNVQLRALPVDGRIVLLPPDDNGNATVDDSPTEAARGSSGNGNTHRR